MEPKYQIDFPGQQIQKSDIETFATEAALADDRVFAELFRMTPYGSAVSKGILPYKHATLGPESMVAPSGADGSITIGPFRAFISSRSAASAGARVNWRDIRSALSVLTADTTLRHTLAISANAAFYPRWDLVYAVVSVDAADTSESRKVKNPTTKVVSSQTVTITKSTSVTLAVVSGTAFVLPTFPSLPSDSGGNYNIPLAYILVPVGFNATSTVDLHTIATIAPCMQLSEATGASCVQPATSNSSFDATARDYWSTYGRPDHVLPSTMSGSKSLLVALNLRHPSSPSEWSHTSGAVIDDSIDWRNRLVKYHVAVTGDNESFPWSNSGASHDSDFMSGQPQTGAYYTSGMGQTFFDNINGGYTTYGGLVCSLNNAALSQIAAATAVILYADATTGFLMLNVVGYPTCRLFVWIDATAAYDNA